MVVPQIQAMPQYIQPQQQFAQQMPMPAQPGLAGIVAKKESQGLNINSMIIMLLVVYSIEHTEACTGGDGFELKYFMENAFWTIIPVVMIMFIISKSPFYKLQKFAFGDSIVSKLVDGIMLFFVYNLMRNFRNITKRNLCKENVKKTTSTNEEEDKKDKKDVIKVETLPTKPAPIFFDKTTERDVAIAAELKRRLDEKIAAESLKRVSTIEPGYSTKYKLTGPPIGAAVTKTPVIEDTSGKKQVYSTTTGAPVNLR